MKVVFKVGDNSANSAAAAKQPDRRTSVRPSSESRVITTWRPGPTYYYNNGHRARPTTPNDGYQKDEAEIHQRAHNEAENRRHGQHESLVKKVRERILQSGSAAVIENSAAAGYCTITGSQCTFLVQMAAQIVAFVARRS
jgi:hypothetical protein